MATVTNGSVSVTVEGHTALAEAIPGYWMVSGPARITAKSPAPTTDGRGVMIHGYQLNPKVGEADISLTHEPGIGPDAVNFTMPPALPVTLSRPGDAFVAINSQTAYVGYDAGIYDECIIVLRVANTPSAGDIPPCFLQTRRPFPRLSIPGDVAAYAATLPGLSATGVDAPTAASVLAKMGQPTIHPMFTSTSLRGTAPSYPLRFGSGTGDEVNFGRNMAATWSAAWHVALLDTTSTADREALLRRIIIAGRQFYEATMMQHPGEFAPFNFRANGGKAQDMTLPVMVYLHFRGAEVAINEWLYKTQPNHWGHVSGLFTQERIDRLTTPHRNFRWPSVSRIRAISAVDENTITLPFNSTFDAGVIWTGNTLVRVSDGATATIQNGNLIGSDTLNIVAQPDPAFQAGQEVYVRPAIIPNVGDYEYQFERYEQSDRTYTGTPYDAAAVPHYADVQTWIGVVTAAAVMGQTGGRLAGCVDLVKRDRAGTLYDNGSLGSSWTDNAGTSYDLDATFYAAHAVALGLTT